MFLLNPIVLLWVKYIILSVKIALSNKNLEKGPRQCYHKVGSNIVHTFLVRFNIYIFSYYSIFSFASFSLEMLREIPKKKPRKGYKRFRWIRKVIPGKELLDCYKQDRDHSPDNSHQTQQIRTTSFTKKKNAFTSRKRCNRVWFLRLPLCKWYTSLKIKIGLKKKNNDKNGNWKWGKKPRKLYAKIRKITQLIFFKNTQN